MSSGKCAVWAVCGYLHLALGHSRPILQGPLIGTEFSELGPSVTIPLILTKAEILGHDLLIATVRRSRGFYESHSMPAMNIGQFSMRVSPVASYFIHNTDMST